MTKISVQVLYFSEMTLKLLLTFTETIQDFRTFEDLKVSHQRKLVVPVIRCVTIEYTQLRDNPVYRVQNLDFF